MENRRVYCGYTLEKGNDIFRSGTIFARSACLFGVLLVAACNSTGKTNSNTDISVSIPKNTTAVLLVKAHLGKDHRYKDRVLETLRQQLPAALVKQGIFRSVVAAPATGNYEIDVEVRGIRVVTPGGRVFFGFMAGRNSVRVVVNVRNSATGKRVRSFETRGYGASIGWGAQSYGADDPVREVVKHVVDELSF